MSRISAEGYTRCNMESNNQTAKVRVKNVAIPIISFLMAVFGTWGLSIGYITSSGPLINSRKCVFFAVVYNICRNVLGRAYINKLSRRGDMRGIRRNIRGVYMCRSSVYSAWHSAASRAIFIYKHHSDGICNGGRFCVYYL